MRDRRRGRGVQSLLGALVHLTRSAYATLPQTLARPTDTRLAARQRVLNFIESHLDQAEPTPTMVAAACGMTPRNLHRLFSDLDQTVGDYILNRRLEECARLLATPLSGGRTVGSIAVDFGFNSLTSFGRTFAKRYGLTPTEYRRRADPTPGRAPFSRRGPAIPAT